MQDVSEPGERGFGMMRCEETPEPDWVKTPARTVKSTRKGK